MKDVSYAELFGGVGQTKNRHFAKLCKIEVKHIDMEEESQDFTQSEYTTPFFVTNDQVKAWASKLQPKFTMCTTKIH